ncbi:uncharacterized protein LOC129590526 isoform X2 [Paramacrobiotus metropolitanus]|uniref:uncharacterized protein LOC129590526 isoform X2 n=1 Tax=Paramacrobiotus metropolitanus TaxID=2943436 RepID=UPI0024462F0E|nr:uncharacterized protein LOC129590526 isoform X2 [Paramacrobiotus metropolitanus]
MPFYGGYSGSFLTGAPPLGAFGYQNGYFSTPFVPGGSFGYGGSSYDTYGGNVGAYPPTNRRRSPSDIGIFAKLLNPYQSLGYFRGNPFRQGYSPFYASDQPLPARIGGSRPPVAGNAQGILPDSLHAGFQEPLSESDVLMGLVIADLLDDDDDDRQQESNDAEGVINHRSAVTTGSSMWEQFIAATASYISQRLRASG